MKLQVKEDGEVVTDFFSLEIALRPLILSLVLHKFREIDIDADSVVRTVVKELLRTDQFRYILNDSINSEVRTLVETLALDACNAINQKFIEGKL